MQLLCTVIGALFLFFVSIYGVALSLSFIMDTINNRKDRVLKSLILRELDEIDKWCNYEFPQVGYTARELIKCVRNEHALSTDSFRQSLRNGSYKETSN